MTLEMKKGYLVGKQRAEQLSDVRCPRCKRMVGDDIGNNIFIVHSTDLDLNKFKEIPDFILEVKCTKCRVFNTIFAGGVSKNAL